FGVMPGHVPSIIALDIGEVSIQQSGDREFWATSGGYAEIHPDRVVLIVESAERSSNIDIDRAKSAAERAKDRLEKKKQEQIDEARARAALNRAMNRLSVAKRS
ncbi:MAG: ATP synthase F1 subunit epsilon, partial [Candidatus Marinimicrobia bacterium]|nr:ATP synthase F1 subunit epsilon [Candidatus Neomarinimicrobiota bacterium]